MRGTRQLACNKIKARRTSSLMIAHLRATRRIWWRVPNTRRRRIQKLKWTKRRTVSRTLTNLLARLSYPRKPKASLYQRCQPSSTGRQWTWRRRIRMLLQRRRSPWISMWLLTYTRRSMVTRAPSVTGLPSHKLSYQSIKANQFRISIVKITQAPTMLRWQCLWARTQASRSRLQEKGIVDSLVLFLEIYLVTISGTSSFPNQSTRSHQCTKLGTPKLKPIRLLRRYNRWMMAQIPSGHPSARRPWTLSQTSFRMPWSQWGLRT